MSDEDDWPTLDEELKMFTEMVADAERDLAYAREQLRRVKREIEQRDLQKPTEK